MPVLPAVPSTMTPPGLSWPRSTASEMMNSAARSFTDWPGFMNSALPRIVEPVSADARLSLTSGVLPMASTMPSRICMAGQPFAKRGRTLDHRRRSDKDRPRPPHGPNEPGLELVRSEQAHELTDWPIERIAQTVQPSPSQQGALDAFRRNTSETFDALRADCP